MTVKGLTTPNCVGCVELFVLCRYEGLACSLLLDWYLWFSKTEGNTYATLLHHPFLFRENQRSAQEVARRISSVVAGEVYAKVDIPSTHHIPLSPTLHYLPFASRFPLPPIHPFRFIHPLSLSPFAFLPVSFLFSRVLVCLFVTMAQDNTKLCDFANTNNDDFLSTRLLLLPMMSHVKLMLLCWILSC